MRQIDMKHKILLITAILILIATFSYHSVFEITRVEGESMENTLFPKDYILLNKIAYHFKSPKRYDVIVFPYDKKNNIYYLKRIIGLPGESIQIINSSIYINGALLYENYGKESMDEFTEGIAGTSIKLKEDEYFVLGDNRNNSNDSRDRKIGPIKKVEILGKTSFRVYPFSSFGKIRD